MRNFNVPQEDHKIIVQIDAFIFYRGLHLLGYENRTDSIRYSKVGGFQVDLVM